jgi:hypothetical protein
MKALSIDAATGAVKEIEITMEANTVYSFFNSILIDELNTLNAHQIHTDANALSNKKNAYFVGEQLLIGDALIVGKEEFEDKDATISAEELRSLVNTQVPQFYIDVLDLLSQTDINLYRTFTLEKGEESMTLNTEWVLYAFNMADEKTQEYFLEHLKKVLDANENVEEYMHKMAGLAINASQV